MRTRTRGWRQAVGMLLALVALAMPPSAVASGESEIYGVVETLPPAQGWVGDWKIGGRTVRVDTGTRIEHEGGPVAVGALVEVKGISGPDGSVRASKIEVKRRSRTP